MPPRPVTSPRALLLIVGLLGLRVLGAPAPSSAATPGHHDGVPAPRLLSPSDVYDVLTVSDPQVSPDGRWVAYAVTRNDRTDDEPSSSVWMVSWDGVQQVTMSTGSNRAHDPRWSPDGRYLSFLATGSSGNTQLLALDRRGGDALPLTDATHDIDEYGWSPDGRQVVLVVRGGQAQPPSKSPRPIVIDALHFKQDEDGYLGADSETHLSLLDVATRQIEPLTGTSGRSERLPAFSPDGKRVAFVSTRERDSDPDGMQDIDLIGVEPGASSQRLVRVYTPNRQKLAWSPHGEWLAYFVGEELKFNQYIQNRLAVIAVASGESRTLAQRLDRPVSSYAFAHDSASLWATIDDDGSTYPVTIDLATGVATRAARGRSAVSSVSEAAGHVAALYSDDTALTEVYALEAGGIRPLTHHNDGWRATVKLGAVEDLRFKSRDRTEIHGLLVKPPGFTAGHRYPAILWIHGGPNGQDVHALTSGGDQLKRQLLAAHGFVVYGINYRGSSGRGRAFADAILADWGHREVEDLLAGTDALIARGIADPQRLGIGGWSYGGILTDYVIARDARFKAAVSGAGSANPLALYGSDEYILQYNNELGVPWANTAAWLKLSYPFFHADRIHTPTLFMGGSNDFDVPLNGGEQMYQALRTLGVPTQLVVYPGEYHQFKRPSFLEDRSRRIAEWFDSRLSP